MSDEEKKSDVLEIREESFIWHNYELSDQLKRLLKKFVQEASQKFDYFDVLFIVQAQLSSELAQVLARITSELPDSEVEPYLDNILDLIKANSLIFREEFSLKTEETKNDER
jgi:hypothetical protein